MNKRPSIIDPGYIHELTQRLNKPEDEEAEEVCEFIVQTIKVRVIKLASLSSLIKTLSKVNHDEVERNFVEIFFTTYRTFSTPKDVLELFFNRFSVLNDLIDNEIKNYDQNPQVVDSVKIYEKQRRNLFLALETWLDDYPEDWDESNLKNLLNFLLIFMPNSEMYIKVLSYLANYLNSQLVRYGESLEVTNGNFLVTYSFPTISAQHFAEQLTLLDVELFLDVIPHECLGGVWSKRKEQKAKSIVKTIDQFNIVTLRVISTILQQDDLQDRALSVSAWIDIAQKLKELKNFSSLKAIISALQSNSIYRLTKTWTTISSCKGEIFTELVDVLVRENTNKVINKINESTDVNNAVSVIPYLGSFLTDLIMLDSALPERNDKNLINFEKKRKEFEIIQEIKKLQNSIKYSYYNNIIRDKNFIEWFSKLTTYDENAAHEISCKLEPSRTGFLTRKKLITDPDLKEMSKNGTDKDNSFYIIRVTYEALLKENANADDSDFIIVKYKSIMLANNERTEQVIQHALSKLSIKGNPFDYTLSQILPDKELVIPRNANVYYAMNALQNLNFILRKKTEN